ncbi:MAG: glycosyltransferase family 4 protein [Bacteroidetes bacterium]|nr:glycosyltransferase family 4 protein [Bacteroidota bacterium]
MNHKKKLLIYSDNYIYGGSERMIPFIIKNKSIQEFYQITFVFRNQKIYKEAVNNIYSDEEKDKILFSASIVSNSTIFHKINLLDIHPIIKKFIKIPFYIIDNLGIYSIYNFLVQFYILLKFSPDLIHINNGGYPGSSSSNTLVFASRLVNKVPIIYQINNITIKTKNPLRKIFDKYINNQVSYFTTASIFSKEKLVNNRNFDIDKIIQVPNTISEEKITISREEILKELKIDQTNFVLSNIGLLTESKGQKYLIEALNLIRLQEPILFKKINLLLIGNGKEKTNLSQSVKALSLGKCVRFLGHQDQFINYLNCSDVFVFPSIANEDMPLVILSAMSLGKTIIATDFAGIKEEIENNKSGILIPANSDTLSQSLANEIVKLYNNKENNNMGENAKKRYSQLFSNSIYCETILNIYNSLTFKGI